MSAATPTVSQTTSQEAHDGAANVAVLAEPPSAGDEFVVAAIGEVVIQPG